MMFRLVLRRAHARRRGGLVPRRVHRGNRVRARARAQPAPAVPPAGALGDVLRTEEADVTSQRCTHTVWIGRPSVAEHQIKMVFIPIFQ